MSIPDGATIGFWRPVVDPGQDVYTVFIEGRTVTPADRGRSTWPRVTSHGGHELIVERAILWLGTLTDRERMPNVVWQFHPIVTATVNGVPTALGLTIHVLELAGFRWPGRRGALHREVLLEQAVAAARRLLPSTSTITRQDIADLLAEEEPGLELGALIKRWDRCRPPITLGEILETATP